jgi:hypothetical protein
MIKDRESQVVYQKEWNSVREFQNKIQRHLNAASTGIGSDVTHDLRNISHNLVLLFAFAVIEDVLKQLREDGIFKENSNMVSKLMSSSRTVIPWSNYDLVDEAREKRNEIAHDQKLISRSDCWKYIDAIENELVSWKVIQRQICFKH